VLVPNFLEVFEQLQSAVQLAVLAASVLVIAAGVPIAIWFFISRSKTAGVIAARVFSWAGILVLSIALVIFDRTADTNDICLRIIMDPMIITSGVVPTFRSIGGELILSAIPISIFDVTLAPWHIVKTERLQQPQCLPKANRFFFYVTRKGGANLG
jgi:hypothetical protein